MTVTYTITMPKIKKRKRVTAVRRKHQRETAEQRAMRLLQEMDARMRKTKVIDQKNGTSGKQK